MAIEKYQGEDLYFGIKHRKADGTYVNLDTYLDIVCYVYTSPDNKKKFSRVTRAGYIPIKKLNTEQYYFWCESDQTKSMKPGTVTIEMWAVESLGDMRDGKYDRICVTSTYSLKAAEIAFETGIVV